MVSVYQSLRGRENIREGTYFGIELEIEGVSSDDVPESLRRFSKVVGDGSLREGIEVVTNPLSLEEVAEFASMYSRWARKHPVSLSERCSTHIHVNVQDMDYEQLRSFLWLSVAVEGVLLSYCSSQRQNNTYTYPTSKTVNMVSVYRELLLRSQSGNLSGFVRNVPKYTAVGIFRFHDYGTVEFRMFDATTDANTLVSWCSMINELRDLAMTNTVEQLRDRKIQEGVLSLLTTTIINYRGAAADLNDLTFILEKGIQMANDIVTPVLTREQIMAKHAELFPEKAPDTILRGSFGAKLLAIETEANLVSYLRKFSRSDLESEYGSAPLFTLFSEMSSNPVKAADIIITMRRIYNYS